ncbi:helix-turn-helix domain-containing protein [Bacteriovorax sp. PP10]|uniref:Helix-turn-helix domain-containing protein n=1 Tax=Bacteriovorax antarcticus TaxID=3088717 RepID=A0ABU5W184_9BACT|nr:helix-turn-helix domain-containing protein [Bacteriovorax sp. PP10]MEA9357585.1 helix-turn-helix domain-containing protein [Bacteriovorax sp. PP10]
MDIGNVSKQSHVSTSTLRYYEEIGLISSTGRKGLRRQYHSSVLERLALINLGRLAGFSLDEIASMFNQSNHDVQIDRSTLKEKAKEIDKKIAKLTAVRDSLIHASNCKAENHLECPTFIKLMKVATRLSSKKLSIKF